MVANGLKKNTGSGISMENNSLKKAIEEAYTCPDCGEEMYNYDSDERDVDYRNDDGGIGYFIEYYRCPVCEMMKKIRTDFTFTVTRMAVMGGVARMKLIDKLKDAKVGDVKNYYLRNDNEKTCVVCRERTFFIDVFTEERICSEECQKEFDRFINQRIIEGDEDGQEF